MEISKYKTLLNDAGLPELVKEQEYEWNENELMRPEMIAEMMKKVFGIHRETEEYLYEVCFDAKMKPVAVFEISHGTLLQSLVSPREVFQKALMCGAAAIAIVHNHPSGNCFPSKEDDSVVMMLKDAGNLMGVQMVDSIIVGDGVYSYHEQGRMQENPGG